MNVGNRLDFERQRRVNLGKVYIVCTAGPKIIREKMNIAFLPLHQPNFPCIESHSKKKRREVFGLVCMKLDCFI